MSEAGSVVHLRSQVSGAKDLIISLQLKIYIEKKEIRGREQFFLAAYSGLL
jgi:hypothetical protein